MNIENNFPAAALSKLAEAEASNRQHYRPIYSVHKYWARRLGSVFRTLGISLFSGAAREDILRFTSNGDIDTTSLYFQKHDFLDKLIYDPFMGAGTTIVELLRLGAKCIGVDLNPVAYWTTRQQVIKNDQVGIKAALEELEKRVKPQIMKYYQTGCPSCTGTANVMYYFWVKTVQCNHCTREVELFKYYVLSRPYRSRKGSLNVLFCPVCREVVHWKGELKNFSSCPSCGNKFDPFKGNYLKGNYICACGFNEPLIAAVKQKKEVLNQKLYALEFYCPSCKVRGYKKVNENDIDNWERALKEFDEKRDVLTYPRSNIPQGEKTRALLNYNYYHWFELFNERQLLSLSMLLRGIMQLTSNENRYFFLTVFSKILEYQNMLCQYNYGAKKIVNSFNHHAYPITTMPIENNPWGAEIGAGTFVSFIKSSMKAKRFNEAPFEKLRTKNGVLAVEIPEESLTGLLTVKIDELTSSTSTANCLIACCDAREMILPEKILDAVITDPPYFDNVMYSELADFFHVWLRLGLKDEIAAFKSEHVPKDSEIVKNNYRTENNYEEGLTSVFTRCHRMLKDEGALVFTFHHKKTEAYTALLEAIIKSNFTITATFHIVSE
ncbi:MAG: hypothetical protein ACFFD4_22485, partial [Candidatus Odinarchaeota archaeon]